MKLQDAYASESNKQGTWKNIGYVAPGATSAGATGTTTNFTYTGALDADADISSSLSTADSWKAKNNVALNECTVEAVAWNITVKGADNGNSLTYEASTTCGELTPTFNKIG